MKRMHLHVGVSDLHASVQFYATLFGAEPTVSKPDYAKWMLEDPRINFAISTGHAATGIEHIGIQAENADELAEVYGRLAATARPVLSVGETNCCYVKSDKNWIADPDGVVWEAFMTMGTTTTYGDRTQNEMTSLATTSSLKSPDAASGSCCVPSLP